MCCFSQPVKSVSATNIFARAGEGARQYLVYSMAIKAMQDLAMILPLPVETGAGEHAVEFIELKDYPEFFAELKSGFPEPRDKGHWQLFQSGAISASRTKLEVVEVGDFEASFVPTIKDFARLDERFRLPMGVWDKLPAYQTYGFAVFKLKPGELTIHPMAFSFPRRDAKTLFFPTVHIHDGKVHSRAGFDHALYCQPLENQHLELGGWRESNSHANSFMRVNQSKGVVQADQHCYLKEMHGRLANRDTILGIQA